MVWKKLLVFSLLLGAAVSAGASTILKVDLPTMVDEAEMIFVGTVVGSEPVPTNDGTYAFTYVTFDIEHALKGVSRSGKTITLRMPGGQSGSDIFEVSGAPTFAVGGQHLLFVQGNDKFIVPLVGWFQGKFDIVPNPISGQPVLVDYTGAAIDGFTEKGFRRDGMKLNGDGSLKHPEDPGVAVVSEEGVRIELPKQEQLVDRAEPVAKVLAELRAYINGRKSSSPNYRDKQFVDSASKANVPATFGFVATPAPVN
ncbi:MAG TPA: hypothetical protein VHL59_06415 [Thermoanaerobaculia bacterium]|nr:hypothetical protein [Thermoanaerobaculia bacterium]